MIANNVKIITDALQEQFNPSNSSNTKRSKENNTDQFQITDCHYLNQTQMKSRIDFLTIQFKPNTENEFKFIIEYLKEYLNQIGISLSTSQPCLKYFDEGNVLQAKDKTKSYCGSIKLRSHCFDIQIELTGLGCNYFNANNLYLFPLLELSKTVEVVIRRIDIAIDSYTQKHGLRYMQQAYSRGLYTAKTGKRPCKESITSETGKTIVIGSRNATKQIVGYEKGKQLRFPKESKEFNLWFRFEVKLRGSKGTEIPLDSLLNPDAYFVGAYPKANQRLITSAVPRSIKREVIKTIDKKLNDKLSYAKHQVGKTIFGAVNRGMSSELIVSKIIRRGKKDNIDYPSYISENDKSNYPLYK